jgi:hypothetical protein
MTTLTTDQTDAIRDYLDHHYLPAGLGTAEAACSIAAINLALTGVLTDDIPVCMSEVVGAWIRRTQDWLDDDTRNSDEWKGLLPLAAGTGRALEPERLSIVFDAMWEALAWVQPHADEHGFGNAWATMLRERTSVAAGTAARAATVAADAASSAAAAAFWAAAGATEAASAAAAASSWAAWASWAACDDAHGQWATATLRRLVA